MHPARTARRSRLCLIGLLCLLPGLILLARRVEFGTPQVESWLPNTAEVLVEYRQFLKRFGEDQFILVSWPGLKVDDPALTELAGAYRQLIEQRPELSVLDVQDSHSAIENLAANVRGLARGEAQQRLSGIAVGRDGTGFLSLQVGPANAESRTALLAVVRESASRAANLPAEAIVLAGEPVQVSVIDRSSRDTIAYFVLPSSLAALVVAWLCLGQIRLTLLVFAIAGLGQLLALVLIGVFLGEMSAVLVVLPTLVFMLTLSAAIHLTNYYLDALGPHPSRRQRTAGLKALEVGVQPCVMATLTTVFGFASLAVSHLTPVWQFGGLAAAGLLLSTTVLLCIFPAATRLAMPRRRKLVPTEKNGTESFSINYGVEPPVDAVGKLESFGGNHARPREASPRLQQLAAATHRYANWITACGLILLAVALAGIPQLRTSTEFVDMFPDNSPAVEDLRWVQQHLGPINTLEFLVDFPNPVKATGPAAAQTNVAARNNSVATDLVGKTPDGSTTAAVDILQRVLWIEGLQRELQRSPHVDSVLSAVTFLPRVPAQSGVRGTVGRAVLRRKLEASQAELTQSQLVHTYPGGQVWRVSAKIREMRGDNYQDIYDALQLRCALFTSGQDYQPVVSISGLRTVVERAHHVLLADLGTSFLTAFALITPVMMLIVRGVFSGLVLMVPNLLPVALVFGCMGWFGIALDVASILTASVALGIAVDDTLHFLSWFLRARSAGGSRQASVAEAVRACARPMLHTSIICTGAMLPFFWSDFVPTSKFALLMILILGGAILGDLILLPAMLQSRLGPWLSPASPSFPRKREPSQPTL